MAQGSPTHQPHVRASTRDRRAELYHDALREIAIRHAEHLTVADVAHSIATSPRQLQRVLAEVGGTSFATLLQRCRVTAAARMLGDRPAAPICTVAREVGYRQAAQFAKTFRTYYHLSPREFRAINRRPVNR